MKQVNTLNGRLDHIFAELIEIKKEIITLNLKDRKKATLALRDLVSAIPEVTQRWSGPDAVEEIRQQRVEESS
jgi:hypothetical protein